MPRALHSVRFPGESRRYRQARNALLAEERLLRRRLEKVAALRRKLPLGGEAGEDYVFDEGASDLRDGATVRQVRLSDLFARGQDTLILYSFMFGPKMETACTSCTSILDGLNGTAPHVSQRVSFAVVARSPIERIREFARGRGWVNLRLLSSARNSYNTDYHAENPDGSQNPLLNVFVRRDGKVHHYYATELLFAPCEKGMDPRHVDLVWPLWNVFDLTPEGRGGSWYPALEYSRAVTLQR